MFLYCYICIVDYIIQTSVDHDDLPDGGSGHFALTVQTMKVVYVPCYSIQLHFCSYLFYAYFQGKDWNVNGIFYGFIYDYM